MNCTHTDQITVTESDSTVCLSCIEQGDSWVHLRMCLVCGQVGCCDSSPNRHMRAHYRSSGHSLIRSIEPGENWRYCYEDRLYLTARNRPVRRG